MTEPQSWVIIGIFGAAIFSTIGLQTASLNRNFTTAIAGLRESMESRFEAVRSEFTSRFESTDAKLDALDRDVQALARRVMGADD